MSYGLKARAVAGVELLVEPLGGRGLATELLLNSNASGFEAGLENINGVVGLGLAAGEDVECGILVLGPGVNRDVGLSEDSNTRDTSVRGEVVEVHVEEGGLGEISVRLENQDL